MDRVAVFVDVQNVYYTVKQIYGCHFDYRAFWDQVTAGREVVRAFAYAIDRKAQKQIQFQQILESIGFEVKLKPFIQRSDGSAKGDWDVGITLDMIELANEVDVAVLASGDGDFDLAVRKLRDAHGVEVEVYGARKLTAGSLIQAATRFVPIEQHLLLSN
ncbi:MAG: NYN domain-containing protein [Planctomycetes bacterium]|nr:NYN domain-containing protein [Planctomycetota bacterium]